MRIMASHRPSPNIKKKAARYWACPVFVLLLLTILVPAPRTWATAKHIAKTPQAKGKTKAAPAPAISFDYSIAADGHNELLIQGDAPMKNYKSFLLANPTRLVLDIPNVTLRGKLFELPVDGPELIRIRIAPHPDKVRFVFDLTDAGGIIHNILPLENGLKVIIASGQDRPAPAAQADTAPAAVAAQESQETQEPQRIETPTPPVQTAMAAAPTPEPAPVPAPAPTPVPPPATVQAPLAAAPELAPTPEPAPTPAPAPIPVPDPTPTPVPAPEKPSQMLSKSEIDALFGTQRVSVVFHKSPAKDFFKYIAEKSGRQVEMRQEITETVSLRLADVPLSTLITAAADTIGFALKKEGNRIIAVHLEDAVLTPPPVPLVFMDSPAPPAKKPAQKKGAAR